MPSVTLAEAQARLPELIDALIPGEELWILHDDRPIAKVIGFPKPATGPPDPGLVKELKDMILYMAPDIDAGWDLVEREK
jgi:antitoxin (DNA-binding transcriptional repressor) of toxin-antitoxin stability system